MRKETEDLKNKLENLKAELKQVQEDIKNFELDEDDFIEEYRNFIDECSGKIEIVGIEFTPNKILEELDPIAFNCGLHDYVDGLDNTISEKYRQLNATEEEIEDEISDLENELEEEIEDEISDLENELEELKNDNSEF